MGLTVQLNGQNRSFEGLQAGVALAAVVEALGLKADRIAVELNGEIAPRTAWGERTVSEGARLEIVHFVGGGAGLVRWEDQRQRDEQRRSREGGEGSNVSQRECEAPQLTCR
jgi:sulfur carrier protein